jgi:hypothetical protein
LPAKTAHPATAPPAAAIAAPGIHLIRVPWLAAAGTTGTLETGVSGVPPPSPAVGSSSRAARKTGASLPFGISIRTAPSPRDGRVATHERFPEKGKREMTLTNMIRAAAAALSLTAAYAGQPTAGTAPPTPGKEVEKPALSAVAASCDIPLISQSNGTCDPLTVPAGKVLVVEHLSGTCGFNDAARVSVLAFSMRTLIGGNANVDIEIPVTKQAASNGLARWKGSFAVRTYANSGSPLQVCALRATGSVTFGYCTVTVIGHYVPTPQ